MDNQIINGDCFEVLRDFPDNSFDAIITDPPYAINLAKWDKVVDIPLFTSEVKRLLNDGFYCFFGQMPTVVNWINEANNKLKYREHIVWAKRNIKPTTTLNRTHESIFVYGGKSYYNQKGKYTDVKLPGIYFDIISIEAIKRHISLMIGMINNKSYKKIKPRHTRHIRKEFDGITSHATEHHAFNLKGECNFTNLWSFLPPNNAIRNGCENKPHPTQKPLELMKRLVEMLTPENGIVLDPFAGSFTTAIACLETGRRYVCIEKESDYFEIGKKRIAQWHNDKLNNTGCHELPEDIDRIKEEKNGQLNLF